MLQSDKLPYILYVDWLNNTVNVFDKAFQIVNIKAMMSWDPASLNAKLDP